MTKTVFVCLRTPELRFASAVAGQTGGDILHCPMPDTAAPPIGPSVSVQELPSLVSAGLAKEALMQNVKTVSDRIRAISPNTVFIPRAQDSSLYDVYASLKETLPHIHWRKFFSGIESYTNPPSQIIEYNPETHAKFPDSSIWDDRFIGVRALDTVFNKSSEPEALSLEDAYPSIEAENAPEALHKASRIFLSAPFSEKGHASAAWHKALIESEFDRGTDLIVLHPGEKNIPALYENDPRLIRLDGAYESFRPALKGKTVVGTFSTATFVLAAYNQELSPHDRVKLACVDPKPAFANRHTPNVQTCYDWLEKMSSVETRDLGPFMQP